MRRRRKQDRGATGYVRLEARSNLLMPGGQHTGYFYSPACTSGSLRRRVRMRSVNCPVSIVGSTKRKPRDRQPHCAHGPEWDDVWGWMEELTQRLS